MSLPVQLIGAVILGAGYGRRFRSSSSGSDKRLHPFNGRTVAECTVEKYVNVFSKVRIVVRPEDVALRAKLSHFPLEIIVAADAQLGMGHSLAAGFTGLTWTWAFLALLDMPFVNSQTLIELRDCAAGQSTPGILRPRLKPVGIPGHPIGWHKAYFEALRASRGDVGAKALLQTHARDIIDINVEDTGILRDIDKPSDLSPAPP